MEEMLRAGGTYDFRRYDQVWQRVLPALRPWPEEARDAGGETDSPAAGVSGELSLPGAEPDPCCMGSEAAADLEVLTGFIEEELTEQRRFLLLARQAPAWAKKDLRAMAESCLARARRLMAVHYLILGTAYEPAVRAEVSSGNGACGSGTLSPARWRAALREHYHAMACTAMNYTRAGEGTADPCLQRLLEELGDAASRRASDLLRLLERSLRFPAGTA